MPWHIQKRDDKFCVIKDADGSTEKCHETEDQAKAHLRALYASEERSAEPVEIRSSAITSVNKRLRIIDLVAVPWDQEADVFWRGEPWREVFVRGAFDGIESHAGRIRVNREHVVGDTVGKVVHFDNATEGEVAQVKIAATSRGDDTLALADEDAISASVGYRVKKPSDVQLDRRNRMRRVVRAFIDHLAMVEAPAYEGARVLAVRAEPSGLQVAEPLPPTPALEEAMEDEILAWARDRLSR